MNYSIRRTFTLLFMLCSIPVSSYASEFSEITVLHGTNHWIGMTALCIFIAAYIFVMLEEYLELSKSKPVLLAAGLIWILVSLLAKQEGFNTHQIHKMVEHNLNEYGAIFLFLMVAMTYINALTERNVFACLKQWLTAKNFTFRQIFWITGILAFFISPIADNLTTALLMGAVIMSIGKNDSHFIALSMINIVVAANAGGAFSPFGDITTLMVWQSGKVDFFQFFSLFIPSLINFLVPASVMTFCIPKGRPIYEGEHINIKPGGITICFLFLVTILLAIVCERVLHLPAFMGMMLGFSLLMFFVYLLKKMHHTSSAKNTQNQDMVIDIFKKVSLIEWDTLLFFFGIIFCVGGLASLGYLAIGSELLYANGATLANTIAGLLSAVIDNIPVVFAILNMNPDMNVFQWLLVTLTAGIGGSVLSIGSAAGVALMGASKGHYSFIAHFKWCWLILIAYFMSIGAHFLLNHV